MNMTVYKWKNEYTKFCFIRNPYDRCISGWKHFSTIFKRNDDLVSYLTNTNPYYVADIEYGHIFMSQTKQIQYNDQTCAVDIIGRFEHLDEDLNHILNIIGFTITHTFKPTQRINVSNTSGSNTYYMHVTSIKFINKLFADDFNNFHYQMMV